MTPGRYLSRRVYYHGLYMGLAIVTVHPDGRITAEPFVAETPNTTFVNHPITVARQPDGTDLLTIGDR